MKAILAAVALVFLAAAPSFVPAAHAEESDAMKQAREKEKKQQEETDRAYRAALKNTSGPMRSQPVDPWANARSPETGK